MSNKITQLLQQHYSGTFKKYGATHLGVDWKSPEAAKHRYDLLLSVLPPGEGSEVLDVGCGYGSFYDRALDLGLKIKYTGVDIVPEMITEGKQRHPEAQFIKADFLDQNFSLRSDYVVCNGIFTQKLGSSDDEMEAFVTQSVERLFELCKKGVAFNLLTNQVDFFSKENYYRSPIITLEQCLKLTRRFEIIHSTSFFEYFIYLYR